MKQLTERLRAIGFTAPDSAGRVSALVGTAQEITTRKEMEVVLRESEDCYRDLVEHSTDLICTYNLQGCLLSVNELPPKLLGYSREELLKMPIREFLLPEARAQFDESLLNIQRDGFVKGHMVVVTKTGEPRIWEYHNTLRTEGVADPIVRGIAHDVTDQKRLERALQLSEEKFAKAFHSSPVEKVITTLQEGLFLDVNEVFERNNGYTRDEVIGRTSIELGIWDDPNERVAVLEQIKKDGRLHGREIRVRTKSGNIRLKRCSAEQIELGGKPCLLATCEDITDHKRAEEELRRLSGQLLRLQDEERRRIARDLHDSTGQDLVALATSLGQLQASIPSSRRKLRKLASQCNGVANRCIREVRTLSYLLHPPMLDEAGLEDAIRHYAEGFAERTGVKVDLEISPDFGRLSRDEELGLFRVVQESLINIQRHSGSHTAKIRLNRGPEEIALQVSDTGRGIAADKWTQNGTIPSAVGVGIPSMGERVKRVGGRLEIKSSTDGTAVNVTLPTHG